MLNTFLSNYFGFNRQQRNGLLVLMCISFLILVARIAMPYFIKPGNVIVRELPLVHTDNVEGEVTAVGTITRAQTGEAPALFVFDPNTVSYDQLLKLGFEKKAARRFIKFRSKGFVFRSKKDLLKLYGMTGDFYNRLEPYILMEKLKSNEPAVSSEKTNKGAAIANQVPKKVELNTADSLALVELNGIGPSFAKRILKYRNLLGGYVALEQLKEVYGLNDEIYGKISGFFTVDASLIKKLDLNKDDFKTLNRHPYLTYEITKEICNQRRKTIITAVTLRDILNDETLYKKVLPYCHLD